MFQAALALDAPACSESERFNPLNSGHQSVGVGALYLERVDAVAGWLVSAQVFSRAIRIYIYNIIYIYMFIYTVYAYI